MNYDNKDNYVKEKENARKASVGWFFLAFFFPIVGLILFFIYKKNDLHISKRLIVGTISGFLASFVSFIVSILLLVSLINNNSYSFSIENSDESHTYNETYTILILNMSAENGTFVLKNNIVRNYFGEYNTIYEGDVRVEETTTQIGTWTITDNDYYSLSVERMFIEFDFSGSGKDKYIELMRNSFKNLYGLEDADKLLDEKRIEVKPIKGLTKNVLLNEEDMSIIEIRISYN